MAAVSLLIPYRPDVHRGRLVTAVLACWERVLPDAEVVIGESPDGPFNRGSAINEAAARASGSVFVIADADVLVAAEALRDALEIGWCFPFDRYYTLTAEWTESVIAGVYGWEVDQRASAVTDPPEWGYEHRHPDPACGVLPCESGCLVLYADEFREVGGFDEGFVGWGYEDREFLERATTVLGEVARVPGPALHLWHPKAEGWNDLSHPLVQHNKRRYDEFRAR